MSQKKLIIILLVVISVAVITWYLYKHYQKQLHKKFPIRKGSRGKGVQLVQITFDSPVTGVWDDTFNDHVKKQTGNDSLEWSKKDLFDYWFKTALTSETFPLVPGQSSGWIVAVQVMLGANKFTDYYDQDTVNLVKKAIGKDTISLMDYLTIGENVFGINVADYK